MIYQSFFDAESIAIEAGCDPQVAQTVAVKVLECFHKSVLVNGLGGSLLEARMLIDLKAAYHLGGIYSAVGERQVGTNVHETLIRLASLEDWSPFVESMRQWEESLSERDRSFVEDAREKPR